MDGVNGWCKWMVSMGGVNGWCQRECPQVVFFTCSEREELRQNTLKISIYETGMAKIEALVLSLDNWMDKTHHIG